MNLTIREDAELQDFALLQFKGRFDPEDAAEKQLMPLGQLFKLDENTYRLEMGIMDLVGTVQKLKQPFAVYELLHTGELERLMLIRGYVKLRVLFDKRPVPIMDRSKKERSSVEVYAPFLRKSH